MAEIKLKEYMYTFEEGGWNTVQAKTKAGAYKAAVQRWKDSDTLTVRKDSVVLATDDGLQVAMSNFW